MTIKVDITVLPTGNRLLMFEELVEPGVYKRVEPDEDVPAYVIVLPVPFDHPPVRVYVRNGMLYVLSPTGDQDAAYVRSPDPLYILFENDAP